MGRTEESDKLTIAVEDIVVKIAKNTKSSLGPVHTIRLALGPVHTVRLALGPVHTVRLALQVLKLKFLP
jgi:hypothetical protein